MYILLWFSHIPSKLMDSPWYHLGETSAACALFPWFSSCQASTFHLPVDIVNSAISCMPTTKWSLISLDFIRSTIVTGFGKIAILFSRLTLLLLNLGHFITCKQQLNFERTSMYRHLCVSVMCVELITSSASSLRQYNNNVLICLWSLSFPRPNAIQNCSNLFFHYSHSSSFLKSNGSGTLGYSVAIVLKACHNVGLWH